MDIEHLIYGIIAVLIGIITRITESRISKREKKVRKIGYSEAAYIGGGWALLVGGIIMIILSIL